MVSSVEGKEMAKVCRKWSNAFHIEDYPFQNFRKLLQRSFFQLTCILFSGWDFWAYESGQRLTLACLDVDGRYGHPRVPTNFRQRREAIILDVKGSMWEFHA